MYRDNFSEENFYKEKIIEMVGRIKNLDFLEKIYYFVKVFLED